MGMNLDPCRIGLVGPVPPPEGGIANQTQQLARLLREDGCEVEQVRTNAPYKPAFIGRIRVVRAFFRLVPYVLELWRVTTRVDLLHVMANSGWSWYFYAAPAIWVGNIRSVPVVVNYRGGGASPFLMHHARYVRSTLRRARAVVVPSGFLREVFLGFGIGSEIVPNVIDTRKFHPKNRTIEGCHSHRKAHIVIMRNLEPIYDIATGIQAFSLVRNQLPDVHLTIAGDGPERGPLEQLTRELELNGSVTFAGRLHSDDVAKLYRSADLMLNSTLVDNMPNSILEAMASGVPIVTTNVGGIPHIVEDGRTALMVRPRDVGAMAEAIVKLLTNEGEWQRVAAAALHESSRYSWVNIRNMWFHIYQRVLEPS